MVLRKRIMRIIKENKGRYIGVFLLLFLGSFSFVWFRGFSGGYEALVNQFAWDYRQEDVSFTANGLMDDLAGLAEETGAWMEEYRYFDLPLSEERELRLISESKEVNRVRVLSGRELKNPGEILLLPNFFKAGGYRLGDTIEVGDQAFIIVGTAALPHYIYPLKFVNDILPTAGFGAGVISAEDMNTFPEAVRVVSARFTDRQDIGAQTAGLYTLLQEREYQLSEWTDASANKRIRMAWATITGMKTMSIPLPSVLFLLCCLIVGLMIWRMVRADGVVIGTLYAQGYRRRELMGHYMTIPLLLSVTSGCLGVAAALPGIGPTIALMAAEYYIVPTDGRPAAFGDIAGGIVMPVLFLGLSCLLVIRNELKKMPSELMKGDRQKARVHALESSFSLEQLPFALRFQLREQMRSIPRLLFLLFGVMAASFMMLIGFTINHSMNTVFQSSAEEPLHYAWEYSFKNIRQGEVVSGGVPFNAIRCYPEGRETAEFYLSGILPEAPNVFDLVDEQGNALPQDQVNMTWLLANRLGLQAGNEITVISKLDGASYTLKIDGIAHTYSGQFLYMPLADFNRMAGMPEDSYSGVFSNQALSYDPGELSGVKDLQGMNGAMEDLTVPMMSVVVGLTAVAAVIGLIIIYLVTPLMIEESRTVISLLHVFGYHEKEVKRLILGGSAPVVVAGFLTGIPVMLISANAMYAYLGEMINLSLPMILSPFYVAISFVLIYDVYQFTRWFCGKKLAAISMSETLKAGNE